LLEGVRNPRIRKILTECLIPLVKKVKEVRKDKEPREASAASAGGTEDIHGRISEANSGFTDEAGSRVSECIEKLSAIHEQLLKTQGPSQPSQSSLNSFDSSQRRRIHLIFDLYLWRGGCNRRMNLVV